jgi:ankyrin repeat protein
MKSNNYHLNKLQKNKQFYLLQLLIEKFYVNKKFISIDKKKKLNHFISLAAEDLSTFNELFTACRLNDIQRFDDLINRLHVLKTIDKSPSIIDILNYQTAGSLDTLLHITSERGHLKLIQRLLNEGSNPALANQRGKYPYNLCKTKETKEIFRLFRYDYPDKYDYTLGQIASGISRDELERQKTNERERRRQTKKRRTDKQRSDQERQLREQEEEQQRTAFLALSDAEKRTLAVHMNFETNKRDELHLGRCWQCAKKNSDEPFTYFDYKFCSTACLKAHRTKSKTTN